MNGVDVRSHDRLEELIAADVLDGLDEADRLELERSLAAHGECQECNRLLAQYSEVAAGLAVALDPAPLTASAAERLLNSARGERPAHVAPDEQHVVRRTRRWLATAAVAACLAVISGVVGWSVAPRPPSGQTAFLAFASQPGTRIVSFQGQDGQHLAVAFHPGETTGWVFGSGLKKPAQGRTYELWYRPGPQATMQPAGLFQPVHGTVIAAVHVGSAFDTLAVSVEPPGGSRHPTTQPVFLTSV